MLITLSPLYQTMLGTLFTWGMTALGAFGCLLHYSRFESRKILDASLGFSAGVMLAASYWSLLSPAEEMAVQSGYGVLSFIPLAVGIITGSLFVFLADRYVPLSSFSELNKDDLDVSNDVKSINVVTPSSNSDSDVRLRKTQVSTSANHIINGHQMVPQHKVSHRLMLMMLAITVHNIPEGMAVGVAFGAAGKTATASFTNARNLAIGIGIQNFPEGLAVSLPLKAAGMSFWRSVWYGQLSGLVEPVAGLLGCLAVQIVGPLLPYALSFAAGAMIYVVFDDIIPESQQMGNGHLASAAAVFGFVAMMCLDMGLG